MLDEGLSSPARKQVARWIVLGGLLGTAFLFAFPVEPADTVLFKIFDVNPRRAVGLLSRLWLYSVPAGTVVGVVFANLVLRSSRHLW